MQADEGSGKTNGVGGREGSKETSENKTMMAGKGV